MGCHALLKLGEQYINLDLQRPSCCVIMKGKPAGDWSSHRGKQEWRENKTVLNMSLELLGAATPEFKSAFHLSHWVGILLLSAENPDWVSLFWGSCDIMSNPLFVKTFHLPFAWGLMTTGIPHTCVVPRAFQNAFSKGGRSECLSYLLQLASVQ